MRAERDTTRVQGAYEATHARLWRSVLAFTRSREITDDAVAEAFAQALRRGDEIRDVEAWVWRSAFAIARGQLADRSKRSVELPELEVADGRPAEAIVELMELLGQLSDLDRELIVLCHVGGWTPTELARVTGRTASTLRVQLHRANRRARALFGEQMEEHG